MRKLMTLLFFACSCTHSSLHAQEELIEARTLKEEALAIESLDTLDRIKEADLLAREFDEENKLRNNRVNKMIDLVNRTLSERAFFTLSTAKPLGLSEEQFDHIKDVGQVQPPELMRKLGYGTPSEFYLNGNSGEFLKRLSKMEKQLRKEEARQVAEVDSVLNENQRQMVRRLYFESMLDRDPVRALLAVGAKPDEELQKRFYKSLSRLGRSQMQMSVMRLINKTDHAERIRELVKSGEKQKSQDSKSEVTRVPLLKYFGAMHPHLDYSPPPRRGRRCSYCDEAYAENDTGFSMEVSH